MFIKCINTGPRYQHVLIRAQTYFKGTKFQRRIQKTHVKNRTLKTVCATVPLMFSNFTSGETLQISQKLKKNSPIFSKIMCKFVHYLARKLGTGGEWGRGEREGKTIDCHFQ
jgi:hypothetical protein